MFNVDWFWSCKHFSFQFDVSSAFNEAQGTLVSDHMIRGHLFFEVYASPTP